MSEFTLGTRWCGNGSLKDSEANVNSTNPATNVTTAVSSNASSPVLHVDTCCKNHDGCEHHITRWKRKYNLFNWRPFTISLCACDEKFYKCLNSDKSNSLKSQDVKMIYFEMLDIPCFNLELRDTRKCVKHNWYMGCEEYAMRTEQFAVLDSVESSSNSTTSA